ncbi:MAG: NUDIX domain-containing protein [Candidatus Yanofskybacteria bacterium]|nr:NUDIX domain-containing protein [Candidatus Yanofskybacteria bacterium]
MPTQESLQRSRKKGFLLRRAAEKEARLDGKSGAINKELILSTAQDFNCSLKPESASDMAKVLKLEQEYFENAMTSAELECFSRQTVVGIGQYFSRGKRKGYVLVLNEFKRMFPDNEEFGLGFPGGRVRIGESPHARLQKESPEETGLICEVLNSDRPPVAEHKVGEEEHLFSAYEVKYVGGRPRPAPTKDEPITAIVFVDEETLQNVCKTNGRLRIKIEKKELIVGILPNHRRVFLKYLHMKEACGGGKNV